MKNRSAAVILIGILVVLAPSLAHAQATLAGVVRDASEAVLPGVTVEVSSPVLIEKVRTAVTDGTGQYRLTQLPPGTYSMTVTLTGFTTVKREGIEVTGSGVIPINIAMRVGAVAETITVSGETPVVDTQSARRQAVLSNEVINTLPATRTYGALLSAIPGLQVQGNGSAAITPFMAMFTANGGRANEGRMMIDGLPVAASFNGGGVSTFIYDTPNADEMQVLVSGALGEAENGGPQVNIVPKAGGNTFKGTAFVSDAGKWSTGNNLDGSCAHVTTASRRDQLMGRQRLGRRSDQEGQAVVLRQRARSTRPSTLSRRLRQPQRRRRDEVDVRAESERGDARCGFQEHLLAPAHGAGDAAKSRLVFPRVPVPMFGLGADAERQRLPRPRCRLGRRRQLSPRRPKRFPATTISRTTSRRPPGRRR